MKKNIHDKYIALFEKIDLVEEKVYQIQDSLKVLKEVLLSSYDDIAGEEAVELLDEAFAGFHAAPPSCVPSTGRGVGRSLGSP